MLILFFVSCLCCFRLFFTSNLFVYSKEISATVFNFFLLPSICTNLEPSCENILAWFFLSVSLEWWRYTEHGSIRCKIEYIFVLFHFYFIFLFLNSKIYSYIRVKHTMPQEGKILLSNSLYTIRSPYIYYWSAMYII